MEKILSQLTLKPKYIFLIDGLGAIITVVILFSVLRPFNEYVGIPQTTLTYLSLIGVFYFLYSITCFLLLKNNWQPFLRAISFANLLYCCLTIGVLICYYPSLTILGVAYFLAEIVVVCGLVFIELKTLNKWTKKQ